MTVCWCSLLHEQARLQGRTLPGLLLANRGECRGCTAAAACRQPQERAEVQRCSEWTTRQGHSCSVNRPVSQRRRQKFAKDSSHFVSFQALEQPVNRRRSGPG